MFYFKSVPFPEGVTQQMVETSLRKVAIKSTAILDFKSTTVDVGTDKLFLGHETKLDLTFTRLRTSFEIFLPKFIIRVAKEPNVQCYDIRVAALPFVVSLIFALGLLASLLGIASGTAELKDSLGFLLLNGIFAGLYYLEFKILTSKVNKAINTNRRIIATS